MTPTELKAARARLSKTQLELAVAMGVSAPSVRNWEQGTTPIPPYVPKILAAIEPAPCWRVGLVYGTQITLAPGRTDTPESAVLEGRALWPAAPVYQTCEDLRTIFFFMG